MDNWGDDGVSADWVIGRFTSVLGPRLTNEVRFQWGRDFEFQTSQPAIPGEPVVPGTTRSPDVTITGTVAFEFGKPNFLERRSYPDERRVQIADTATLLWNTHLIKFGIDFNRTHDTLDNLFQEGGVYTYNSRADFISDYELNTKLGRAGRFYSTFAQGIGPTAFSFATMDFAGFIQDTWHVQAARDDQLGPAVRLSRRCPIRRSRTRSSRGPACSPATRTTGDRASASTGT